MLLLKYRTTEKNGLISEYSSLSIDFTMRLYLARAGMEYFDTHNLIETLHP
mgnify:CR=1 FL=1